VTLGMVVVTGNVVVTFGIVVVIGSVVVGFGSADVTGSVVEIGGSAVVIVTCGTAERPGMAMLVRKPSRSTTASAAARLTSRVLPRIPPSQSSGPHDPGPATHWTPVCPGVGSAFIAPRRSPVRVRLAPYFERRHTVHRSAGRSRSVGMRDHRAQLGRSLPSAARGR